ncbi:MAG TPA: arginine--tRNA ligase [Candidatus Paceibacterota bacterium]|nr:arginine--tRNA ligase [Candidatus Paceibacterota bacterium]
MQQNLLEVWNSSISEQVNKKKDEVIKKREAAGYVPLAEYVFEDFKKQLRDTNKDVEGFDTVEIEFIDREKFNADIAIKVPHLMKTYGIPTYTKEYIPQIISNLERSSFVKEHIEKITPTGIYINLLMKPGCFSCLINNVLVLGDRYGYSDKHRGESIVLDYSSPNMAKHLHAGHVRSTIIGEVLAKIYEATGYTVHRLNYLNDWGGMGAIMEAYLRLKDKNAWSLDLSGNDMLYQVYLIVRTAEKMSTNKSEFDKFLLGTDQNDVIKKLLGDFADFAEYKNKYVEFVEAGKERFRKLEDGGKDEFALWQKMREWSLSEFNKFYEILNIKHDYLLGESFYAKSGADLVKELLKTGGAVQFTQELADVEIKKAQLAFEAGTIKKAVLEKLLEEISHDIGAYVIMLPSGSRMVIMRADGATIYATRDLVSAKHRLETFIPSRLVYEVGQEQTEHFKHLFEAVLTLNLNKGANIGLEHVYHGFYVDAATGQKLSSREGAQNVVSLVEESIKYFRNKYEERSTGEKAQNFTDEEKEKNSKLLAVGSIAFNDIKQDKKFPIAFHKELDKNIRNFEESGGAYIMYSIARARSILRKSDKKVEDINIDTLDFSKLENVEISLIKKVAELPIVVRKAAETDNPATLAEHLLHIANDYNSYYENFDVLESGKLVYPHRLLISSAVATAMANGLKLCHAEAPERI